MGFKAKDDLLARVEFRRDWSDHPYFFKNTTEVQAQSTLTVGGDDYIYFGYYGAGANVLNLTGTERGEASYRAVAEHGAAVILCYVQGANVRAVGDFDLSIDPVPAMYEFFAREIETATRCGVEKIFVDPGMGFYYRNLQDSAVRVRHQMTTFLNTFRLRTLGFPTCHALPHAFEFFGEEVRCAEPFFAVLAALIGFATVVTGSVTKGSRLGVSAKQSNIGVAVASNWFIGGRPSISSIVRSRLVVLYWVLTTARRFV